MSLDATPLANKTAVVLGGTGGIGLAVAQLFAEAGTAVAVVAGLNSTMAREHAQGARHPHIRGPILLDLNLFLASASGQTTKK